MTPFTLFDVPTSVAQCQARTAHSRSFLTEIKPKIVETASVCYSEKTKIVSVTSEKIRYFFTADNMHFICFRYALDSLLGIK